MEYALVLACDLTPDGQALGPATLARLQRGLTYARETGVRLVVAGSWSPRHPQQSKPMAEMMADWLVVQGQIDVCVLRARVFNTRGELSVACQLTSLQAIISDPLHLKRVKIILQRLKGCDYAESLEYVPTPETSMTDRGQSLELAKCAFVRYCPFWLQDVTIFLLHHTPLRRINLSY